MRTPDAEVDVDAALVASLLADQHPDLAVEPLEPLSSGFDNVLFRLGAARLVRLPRREAAAARLGSEHHWLPELAPRLPVPAPVPERVGRPGRGYPWGWSVVPWLPGVPADLAALDPEGVVQVVDTLRALHVPAPDDAPHNPLRAVPLEHRREALEARLEEAGGPDEAWAVWRDALEAPRARSRRWVHGDLHPRNWLVEDGRVAALIDWGDLSAGDVATDLACLWMLVDDPGLRAEALAAYGADPALVARARGWAVAFGAMLATVEDSPHFQVMGRETLERVSRG